MREIKQEMSSIKTRVVKLEEKTVNRDDEDFNAAVWEHIQKFKANEEISLRRNNSILQGVKEPTTATSEKNYEEDLCMVLREAGLHDRIEVKVMTRLNTAGGA